MGLEEIAKFFGLVAALSGLFSYLGKNLLSHIFLEK